MDGSKIYLEYDLCSDSLLDADVDSDDLYRDEKIVKKVKKNNEQKKTLKNNIEKNT